MSSQEDYWQIQDPEKPLFDDMLWSRPENKLLAGKILIVGGNVHSFLDIGSSYAYAKKAGAGTIKIVMPDALKKTVGKTIENTYFCPSTPSGSFARRGLAEILDYAAWADIVLLAGDFGRNSETAILLESLMKEYKGKLCITKDALDYFVTNPLEMVNRSQTFIVGTVAQLQKLSIKTSPDNVIRFNMSLVQLVSALHDLTIEIPAVILIKHLDEIVVAVKGQVSSTKVPTKFDPWRVQSASFASVWLMQNSDSYKALTTSIVDMLNSV